MSVSRVIDASVLIKAYVPEVFSEKADKVMERMARGSVRYIAPDLLYPEIGNILWKKHGIKELEALVVQDIIESILALPLKIVPSKSLIHLAVDLGMQYSITVYDALYLSLAKIYEAKLITADKKLVNSLKQTEERDYFEWLGSVDV